MSWVSAEQLASRMTKARKLGGGWQTQCPAHPDRGPSLSITDGDRATLVHCHAGCQLQDVLDRVGLTIQMLFRDYNPDAGGQALVDQKLRKILKAARRPPDYFLTLGDIMLESIGQQQDHWWAGLVRARSAYPELVGSYFPSALRNRFDVKWGPLYIYMTEWMDGRKIENDSEILDEAMQKMSRYWYEEYA